MWSFRCRLLIVGYVRETETITVLSSNIPDPIKHIIFLYYPKRCDVYGIGANPYNELGLSGAVKSFTKLSAFSKISFDPDQIYCGYHRFAIKSTENRIYSIGNNYNGDCGIGHVERNPVLTQINMKDMEFTENIEESNVCVATGSNTLVFCINNTFYGTGINSNRFGANTAYSYKAPIKMELKYPSNLNNIVAMECSSSHILCLNDVGIMFSWGSNGSYQCGIDIDANMITRITPIKCEAIISKICIGGDHNLCISDKNKFYVFGKNANDYGCGIYDNTLKNIKTPTLHPFFEDKNIVFAQTKRGHSLCIDSNDIAYLFGQNSSYQVSKLKPNTQVTVFQALYPEYKDVRIKHGCCGNIHTILLSKNNGVISFGCNSNKQCSAINTESPIKFPYMVTNQEIGIQNEQQIVAVYAGDDDTLIVVES